MDGGGWTEIRDAREGCELKEGEEGDREERKEGGQEEKCRNKCVQRGQTGK